MNRKQRIARLDTLFLIHRLMTSCSSWLQDEPAEADRGITLTLLRNWQKRGAELSLTSVSPKGRMQIFEVSVWILSVGESKLALLNIQSRGETETLDLRGATFTSLESRAALELTFADGKKTLLRERRLFYPFPGSGGGSMVSVRSGSTHSRACECLR